MGGGVVSHSNLKRFIGSFIQLPGIYVWVVAFEVVR